MVDPGGLVQALQELQLANSVEAAAKVVSSSAWRLVGADGAAFVMREGEQCRYVDVDVSEDALSPIPKGRVLPMSGCVGGWSMRNHASVEIPDIHADERVPVAVYGSASLKGLAAVPVRTHAPIGALEVYWSSRRHADAEEMRVLQILADSVAITVERAELYGNLKESLSEGVLAREELTRQLDLRDEFISICVHELRTPLTSLVLQIDFLNKTIHRGGFSSHSKEPYLAKLVSVANHQVEWLNELIGNLREIARTRSLGIPGHRRSSGDLSAMVARIVDEPPRVRDRAPYELTLQEGLQGDWDLERLEQAIRNLLLNATKFGQQKPILVNTSGDRDFVRLVVRDNGSSAERSDLEKVFSQLGKAGFSKNLGGAGLRLFVAKQIAQAHGGRLSLVNEEDQGTTLTLELPRKPGTELPQ